MGGNVVRSEGLE